MCHPEQGGGLGGEGSLCANLTRTSRSFAPRSPSLLRMTVLLFSLSPRHVQHVRVRIEKIDSPCPHVRESGALQPCREVARCFVTERLAEGKADERDQPLLHAVPGVLHPGGRVLLLDDEQSP